MPTLPRCTTAIGGLFLTLAVCAAPTGCAAPDLSDGLVDLRPAEIDPCWPAGGRAYTGGTADTPVEVILLGEGDDGVLLLPGSGGNYCQWADHAQWFADQGYQVASVAWQWADTQLTVRVGVAALRDAGADRYVAIGASLGGAQAVLAARTLTPQPAGVVGLSPSYVPDAASGEAAYDGPLLVIASTNDSVISARTMRDVADESPDARYVELSGVAHGVSLIRAEHRVEVERLVQEFLAVALAAEP